MSAPVRGQCRRTIPSLILPDGTGWMATHQPCTYEEVGPHVRLDDTRRLTVQRVDRSTQWGNPWEVVPAGPGHEWRLHYRTQVLPERYATERAATEAAVDRFRQAALLLRREAPSCSEIDLAPLLDADVLACWCPIGTPCHADVLCELVGDLRAARS